ncbi:hypothetical protein JMC51_005014, partial [Vibrio parahaemolyticus]|nr:hypothetical protein [Vibrio parahaemolyticus]EHA6976848.1 hypothetical protein [Vibrio parahaemolyticus]
AVRNNVAIPESKKVYEGTMPLEKPDHSAWYFEQAKRMQAAGQDPLGEKSAIANKLRELNWKSEQ